MIIFIDIFFCVLSVGNHVDAVEAARFKRKRGLTRVKKASRMLADSMAEVSMYARPFSAANWAAVDSSISLRSKRSALLPKSKIQCKVCGIEFAGIIMHLQRNANCRVKYYHT